MRAMAWNLKQKAQDNIVSIVIGLIVLLSLIVWRAVDPSVWDKVSEATPKRALWALLGLAAIAICLLAGALIDNWLQRRGLSRFGVRWDKKAKPLCPGCRSEMFISHAESTYDVLQCSKCKMEVPLVAENSQPHRFFTAKAEVEKILGLSN
jgi:hypothetical protein